MCSCLSPASTGDLARNPHRCPDWESNQWPFGSQASTQSTKRHHPGPISNISMGIWISNDNLSRKMYTILIMITVFIHAALSHNSQFQCLCTFPDKFLNSSSKEMVFILGFIHPRHLAKVCVYVHIHVYILNIPYIYTQFIYISYIYFVIYTLHVWIACIAYKIHMHIIPNIDLTINILYRKCFSS